ncbi:LysR family transcriptional regulator [Xylanibacillus composti]|uniref:LysR family transcriptional regulator n=1 Tax=Xylanibacillus composti TaxID=1572762 RepID=A0A8J4H2U8_9BACL|nr:LysR family transcriptional regulator [Xylanibacillus composti]MDT9726468.1 LysR family transcriptional regulator [Xylanibacillus composti]GIQ69962.1 LysR family transcriptional regulator [Xylanibacillus composti]
MTLLQLQVFVAIVETQSFTRAGEQLGLSQSAVSHSLRKLEEEWGVKLLERSRSSIELTPVGQRLFYKAKEMIWLGEIMEQEVAKEKGLLVGTVRLGSFPTASAVWLPNVFVRFQELYPNIEVRLLEGGYGEIRAWLHEAKIDLALLPVPDAEFDAIPLVHDPFVIVVPEEHPLSLRPPASIQELDGSDFIMPLAGLETAMRKWLDDAGIQVRVVFSLQNTSSILAMVRKGLGISVVPSSSPIPPGVHVLPLDSGLSRTIGLAARSLQQIPPAVQAMVKVFEENFT